MSSNKRLSVDYDFTPQLKRLSFDDAKEFKQSVYDKTIEMLYKGAKSRPTPVIPVRSPVPSMSLPKLERKQFKQILLDNNGKLDCKRSIYNSKEYCPSVSEKCSFCERLNCFTPLNQCYKCNDYYCGNCSLFLYNENEEVPLCLSCFK